MNMISGIILNAVASYGAVLTEAAGKPIGKIVLYAVIIGVICGFIYALALKSQLTSVYKNNSASDYTRKDSFKVTFRKEIFLGSKTETIEKPKQAPPPGK